MNTKAERRAARERVAAYHESCLTDLVAHVAEALEKLRKGEVDVYDVDETIHQYHRATQELWKFCWGGGSGTHIDLVDRVIQQNQSEAEARTGGSEALRAGAERGKWHRDGSG